MSNCGNPANQSVVQQQVEFHRVGLFMELHVHPTLWSWLVEQPLGKAFMCLLELSKASTATDFGGGTGCFFSLALENLRYIPQHLQVS